MALLADFVGMGQLSTILALFLRNKELPAQLRDNRVLSVFAIWLGGSMVRSAIVKTGAFEVYLGDKLLWSSVKKGETPKLQDLIDSFQAVGVKIKA